MGSPQLIGLAYWMEWIAEEEAARVSRVFFQMETHTGSPATTPGRSATPGLAGLELAGLTGKPGQQTAQDKQLAFLNAPVDRRTTSADRIMAPASPFVLQAGAVIPAALITGIRSDLPGQIIAQVTEPVYDSPTGRILLVPQGTRIIGQYDNAVQFGQTPAIHESEPERAQRDRQRYERYGDADIFHVVTWRETRFDRNSNEAGRICRYAEMMTRSAPEWFKLNEEATSQITRRIADAVSANAMTLQVKSAPMLAHWFILDTLLLASQANRDGMHANALALTRQCVEAIGVVELGVCGHHDAEATLLKWDADELTSGKLRAWLQAHVWPRYGSGLWNEPWSTFMREFTSAIQPYAHYGRSLAQWQLRLHRFHNADEPNADSRAIIEMRPRAYDAQKATRITLFHALLSYVLGRIWQTANPTDTEFAALMARLGMALGKSRYLDGHQTDWSQQFWAMVWERGGGTLLK